ncbi:MAG TPA: glycoside hydrolase family 3 N-terminal domain-containing protein [Bacteroidales bacterium]|nr:glycoside hydrolase family 3 N-terminal domain-containing protein [Bacteroidales bacterium]
MLALRTIPAFFTLVAAIFMTSCLPRQSNDQWQQEVEALLQEMTLDEKIGQLQLLHSPGGDQSYGLLDAIREGSVGAVLNEARPEMIHQMQQAAVEESPHGIPLLFGRDVIHGFKTIFPINIGMAATFNPGLVKQGAEIAASEAASVGINWNFAPMVDIARDPRWGRMAESFGEDPLLVTQMGLAMLSGFQENSQMAACAKHFAGYGAAEGGRDYNTASIPDVELWNTYFPPFMALKEAGIPTFMTGFNELNGIPASGNAYLFRDILKDQWEFDGFVVSDWASISEMRMHGYVAGDREAAKKAILGGVDMEMASTTFRDHLADLLAEGEIPEEMINDAVRRILRVKFELGLFEDPYAEPDRAITTPPEEHLEVAKQLALQSFVLLKNENHALPLSKDIGKLAIIGPMADDKYEQLGTWIFDGDTNLSITPLMALRDLIGEEKTAYAKGLPTTRSTNTEGFKDAMRTASGAEAVVVFAGEESIITGEAHSRAFLDLPGAQEALIKQIAGLGKVVILVVMTPRPLCIGEISEYADAVLYAWHPGTMAGPALAEVLFGKVSPSGKLPVTFPKTPGQIPIYYAHKNTGRPADANSFVPIEEIPVRSFQTSLGNTSHYLDVGFEPLYPFGYGLSYTQFEYDGLQLSSGSIGMDEELLISLQVSNTGQFDADEVVQLYVQDMVASITRPVKELKAFERIRINAGMTKNIEFSLSPDMLGFYDKKGKYIIEAGEFRVWAGGSSEAQLTSTFNLTD